MCRAIIKRSLIIILITALSHTGISFSATAYTQKADHSALRPVAISNDTIDKASSSGQSDPTDMPQNEIRQELLSRMKEYDESANSAHSYVNQQAPELNDYTVVSLQFEAGLDRGLLEKLIMEDDNFARFIAQVTMTGGLGALMHDLPCAWKKNGVDVVSINPLYNSYIKGDVVHYDKETGQMQPGMPAPEDGKSLGGKIKNVLDNTGISFDLTFDSQEFMEHVNSARAKDIAGRTIHTHVYETVTKYGNAPIYYLDAYYLNDGGTKEYIFDQVYPDNDFRDFQMVVFNEAQQCLLKILQKQDIVKRNILFVENEVVVALPKKQFPNTIRHHINHTVWEPGMHKPPEYAFSLMGFDESIRELIVTDGRINIAEYASLTADAISGVGLYEHTGVLKDKIFRSYRHKIAQHSDDGMRNTNGALLDQWQGEEVRMLINQYKDKLGLDKIVDDREFYSVLDKSKRNKTSFLKRFEMIKVLYSLELLNMLYKTQRQDMGGSNWLNEILKDSGLELKDIDKILDQYRAFIYRGLSGHSRSWPNLHRKFARLIESVLSAPMIANVRRQVVYKGPDKYLEMLRYFEADKEALDEFKSSGTMLIIGGRIFDSGVRYLFEKELKHIAKRLGLEDRIAFIENYNIADAPNIFKGVAATIMLSDEFLEASATSMMKGVTNAAALIGVFGGAMPELFDIIDTETGGSVDVLSQDITYDDIESGLENGKYIITNGYLVLYSPLSNERSNEKLGERRPSAASLLKSIISIGTTYKNEGDRRGLIFDVLANSYRVDMERSQARAHIHIWRDIIKKRENLTGLIKRFIANNAIEKMSQSTGNEGFVWKYKKYPTAEWKLSLDVDTKKSLLSFLDSFRRVRSSKEGFNSFLYHCSKRRIQTKQAERYGDVLAYLLDVLSRDERSALLRSIVLDMIDTRLEGLDVNIKDVDLIKEKALITLEIMDFTDNIVRALIEYYSIGNTISRLINERDRANATLTSKDIELIRGAGSFQLIFDNGDIKVWPLDKASETGVADLLRSDKKRLSAIKSAA